MTTSTWSFVDDVNVVIPVMSDPYIIFNISIFFIKFATY